MSTPRPSASVLIVNKYFEVLLVQRNPKSSSFAGMHVFPGGNYDDKQDHQDLRVTAIREAFEESGVLITTAGTIPEDLEKAREQVHSQKTTFDQFLNEHRLTADVESCLPFTTWITPKHLPKRWRTEFFIHFLDASSRFSSGHREQKVPTSDGGLEIISARFVHPSEALELYANKKIKLMPPQYYLIHTLAQIHAQDRLLELARGSFGKMVINPEMHEFEKGMAFVYEGDEARGGLKGTFHRVELGEEGLKGPVTMRRNFDLFKDVDSILAKKSNL